MNNAQKYKCACKCSQWLHHVNFIKWKISTICTYFNSLPKQVSMSLYKNRETKWKFVLLEYKFEVCHLLFYTVFIAKAVRKNRSCDVSRHVCHYVTVEQMYKVTYNFEYTYLTVPLYTEAVSWRRPRSIWPELLQTDVEFSGTLTSVWSKNRELLWFFSPRENDRVSLQTSCVLLKSTLSALDLSRWVNQTYTMNGYRASPHQANC